MRIQGWLLAVALGVLAVGCGDDGGSAPDSGTAGVTLTFSSGFGFSPSELTVDPGTVITVKNEDSTPHTATSEAADDDFTPGGVGGVEFDTSTVPSGGSAQITLPASAPSGTVIPFYCEIHKGMMVPANGHITIR